jgi:hypothetical protein
VAGASFRYVSERYGTSTTALFRHKQEHVPAHLSQAQEAEAVANADDLLGQVRSLQGCALAILDQAEQAGDLKVALGAVREARGNLELLAKLQGQLQQEGTINVTVSAEWLALRAAILGALAPYADARAAVATVLVGMGGDDGR